LDAIIGLPIGQNGQRLVGSLQKRAELRRPRGPADDLQFWFGRRLPEILQTESANAASRAWQ